MAVSRPYSLSNDLRYRTGVTIKNPAKGDLILAGTMACLMLVAAGCGSSQSNGAGPAGASGKGGAAGMAGGTGMANDAGSLAGGPGDTSGGGTTGPAGGATGAAGKSGTVDGGSRDLGVTDAGPTAGTGGKAGAGGTSGNKLDGGVADAKVTDGPATPDTAKPGEAGSGSGPVAAIKNGVFWDDTRGKRIEAHGGGFLKVGDTWYWVGEDKSANSGNFKAVNVYASKDLTSWEFRNAIITKNTASELATADRIIERPKIIYNDTTKKYVMWLHWEGASYAEAKAGVFTCDTVDGDYTYVSSFRPNDNMSRDCNLFKDDDGKAYFMSSANENKDMMLYLLSDDYLKIEKQVLKLWAGSQREAPAMFKDNGTYYFITSGCTGWDPNQAKYATATKIEGPWSSLQNLADSTTYDTQSTFVIPIVGSQTTTYIYAGDRWQDPDLVSSKYIWLPLKVKGTSLALDKYDQWQIDLGTGKWTSSTSPVDDGYVDQSAWTLVQADSEEIEGENGAATNAFDGSASTIWHTQYTGTTTKHPHEIQIDLGASYALTGFRYLPRQDTDDHGMVAKYEFYVSASKADWGSAVATGTFTDTRSETKVPFPSTVGRYIRFVALSEINGKDWTSVAELDVIGTAQ